MTAKVWEETWTTDDSSTYLIANDESYFAEGGSHSPARMRLASAAPDMARVLLAIEADEIEDCGQCPSCDAAVQYSIEGGVHLFPPHLPHAADCALDAALRKAGVR